MIRSSIDLGTNTCLLLVIKEGQEAGGESKVLGDFATVVRLGQAVDSERKLHPDAMERTLACLRDYAKKLRELGGDPRETVAVATSQARDARNGQEFFAKVKAETGFGFRVISGDAEAALTFLGALLPSMEPEHSAVIDIGGGSTELISRQRGQSFGRSIDVGSVRFTERYLKSDPVKDEEFWSCQEEIDRQLESFQSWRQALPRDTRLVGVAGTVTTLAAWQLNLEKFDPRKVDHLGMSRGDVHRLVEELKWRTVEERTRLPGVDRGRADVLLAGALILWRTMEVLGFDDVTVSTRGLRYGVLRPEFRDSSA